MPRVLIRPVAAAKRPPLYSGAILVVASHAGSSQHVEAILREEDHRVVACAAFDAALQKLEKADGGFDAILIIDRQTHSEPEPPSVQWIHKVHFLYPHLPLILVVTRPSAELVRNAFQAGIADLLMQPVTPHLYKQTVRRALELQSILTMDYGLQESHRLNESLKAITACQDAATLNRITPELLSRNFRQTDIKVGLFKLVHKGKKGLFVPITNWRMKRHEHAVAAEFLSWFYKKSWRRFNRVTPLRGTYRPWEIKKKFGRYNLLIPIRHKEGLWGAVLVSRNQRRLNIARRERARAQLLGLHLARTYYILEHYRASNARAFLDGVTGLYNQSYLDFYGEHELLNAKRAGTSLSVMAINVVSFRQINDQYGHLAGGRLLSQVGKILKEAIRGTDIVIRMEADSFMALLRKTALSGAKLVDQRLHDLLQKSEITLSQGIAVKPVVVTSIATFPQEGETLKEILQLSWTRLKGRRKKRSHA